MSIDRAKALKAAQKYLAKGQIDRAITEYEKMVAADPSDARSVLKLGDLYTRKGDNRGASATYRKVAQQYAAQGFFLKAVAVYKQILKLEPGDLQAVESLAEMYEALSLVSDALATYEQVADAYADAGQPEKALNALGKITKLDASSVAAWVRYAEALSKADQIDEAAAAFRAAADLLESQGRTDDFIKVTERLLFHSHEDIGRARQLAAIYIERGQAKTALTHLQTCFKADAKNIATLELLAQAFALLEQAPKAVSVYKEIARLHAEANRFNEEAETLRRLIELDADDVEAGQRLQVLSDAAPPNEESGQIVLDEELDEVVIVDDETEGTQPRIEPPPGINQEKQAQVIRLMAECEVFLRYGLRDKVIAQLNRVLDLDPNHIEAREKLKEAHLKRGEVQSAVTQLLLLSETVAASDPGRERGYLEQAATLSPGNEAVTARLRELQRWQAGAKSANAQDQDDDVIMLDEELEDEADFSDLRSDRPAPAIGAASSALAAELEGNDDPELVLEDIDEEGLSEPPRALAQPEPARRYVSMPPPAPRPEPKYESSPRLQREHARQLERDADDEPTAVEELSEELSDALEEADFYLAQKLMEEAREVLMDALDAHGEHPALRKKLAALDGPASNAKKDSSEAEDHSFALAQKLAEEGGGTTQAAQGPVEVAQVLKQFKEGIRRQVPSSDTATHYDLGIAYMEMGLQLEAIEEFRLCLGKPDKHCTAHTMIGLSYVARGDMPDAIAHFKLALESPVRTNEEEIGLWFELGNASELLGKASEALIWYEKVEERNPEFRDVSARIERLGVLKSPQQEGDEFDQMFESMILKE